MSKIQYNKNQAEKYGWEPSWFGATSFDEELVRKIKEFQEDNGLDADGMCGPQTYRRIWTVRSEAEKPEAPEIKEGQQTIVHRGKHFPIKWDKVVLWDEKGGLPSKRGTFKDYSSRSDRNAKIFVTHWDVCLSSKSCAGVLNKRGLSVHFLIDNDGTIYQCLDTEHVAYHAGNFNKSSIGVEVSCAYYTKYQSWYEKNGFGPRPVLTGQRIHGSSMKPFLGFYDVQKRALEALWEAVSEACGIPLEVPEDKYKVSKEVTSGKFSGFVCHYHLTRGKIDCAGLDLDEVRKNAQELKKN